MNMGGAQFLSNFQRETKLRKTGARGKNFAVRFQVQPLKSAEVSLEEVLERLISHIAS